MSRKKTQPKKNITPDPKFNSTIIPKLINNIMFDGKKGVAAKIVYDAIEKIKTKSKEEPINIFNEAINNIKPTVEVRSIFRFISFQNRSGSDFKCANIVSGVPSSNHASLAICTFLFNFKSQPSIFASITTRGHVSPPRGKKQKPLE